MWWFLSLHLSTALLQQMSHHKNEIPYLNTHPKSIRNHIKTQSSLQENVLMQNMRENPPSDYSHPDISWIIPSSWNSSTHSLLKMQMFKIIETALCRQVGRRHSTASPMISWSPTLSIPLRSASRKLTCITQKYFSWKTAINLYPMNSLHNFGLEYSRPVKRQGTGVRGP
jgi:hypothetical protein